MTKKERYWVTRTSRNHIGFGEDMEGWYVHSFQVSASGDEIVVLWEREQLGLSALTAELPEPAEPQEPAASWRHCDPDSGAGMPPAWSVVWMADPNGGDGVCVAYYDGEAFWSLPEGPELGKVRLWHPIAKPPAPRP